MRRHAGLMFCLLLFSAIAFAQQTSNLPDWENPAVFSINKEPAHATFTPYPSEAAAMAGKRENSTFVQSLNGMWKFHWVKQPDERPIDFYKPDYDVNAWKEI